MHIESSQLLSIMLGGAAGVVTRGISDAIPSLRKIVTETTSPAIVYLGIAAFALTTVGMYLTTHDVNLTYATASFWIGYMARCLSGPSRGMP